MFLLKRKSDGKFYTNRGDRWSMKWVDNPQECKPFATSGGVRTCRAVYGLMPDKLPGTSLEAVGKWFSKDNVEERRKFFDERFEIVEVKYEF